MCVPNLRRRKKEDQTKEEIREEIVKEAIEGKKENGRSERSHDVCAFYKTCVEANLSSHVRKILRRR